MAKWQHAGHCYGVAVAQFTMGGSTVAMTSAENIFATN